MIVAHVIGIPVEESLPTVLAGGAAAATLLVVGAQAWIRRLGRVFRLGSDRKPWGEGHRD